MSVESRRGGGAEHTEAKPEKKELSPEEKAYRERAEKTFDAFSTMAQASNGLISLCSRDDRFRSGDAGSLFTVVRVTGEDGQSHIEPHKVAWGEFGESTFEGELPDVPELDTFGTVAYQNAQKQGLRSAGIPLFVLSQRDGYFAFSDEATREAFQRDPLPYLAERTRLGYIDGELSVKRGWREEESADLSSLEVPTHEEALTRIRNQAIRSRTTPEAFADFLRRLPDDPQELSAHLADLFRGNDFIPDRDLIGYNDVAQQEQYDFRHFRLLKELGISQNYRLCWGHENDAQLQEVLDLKANFDFEVNEFTAS